MNYINRVLEHYQAPNLIERIDQALTASDIDPYKATVEDFSTMDEFHLRGAAATEELIKLLDPTSESQILDAGSGLGGPARRLAQQKGCKVIGVDLCEDYCKTGNILSDRLGLASRVRLETGNVCDLSQFESNSFDGAWSIHVGMNIKNKNVFYNQLFQVLKPNTKLVIYDVVVSNKQGEVAYPMPWANESSTSFLVTEQELIEQANKVGFEVLQSIDMSKESLDFASQFIRKTKEAGSPPATGIHILLGPVFRAIAPNILSNLQNDSLRVVTLVFKKPL